MKRLYFIFKGNKIQVFLDGKGKLYFDSRELEMLFSIGQMHAFDCLCDKVKTIAGGMHYMPEKEFVNLDIKLQELEEYCAFSVYQSFKDWFYTDIAHTIRAIG